MKKILAMPISVYICVWTFKKRNILLCCREQGKRGKFRVMTPSKDGEWKRIVNQQGFILMREREYVAEADIESLFHAIPKGYSVTSINEGCDIKKFNAYCTEALPCRQSARGRGKPCVSQKEYIFAEYGGGAEHTYGYSRWGLCRLLRPLARKGSHYALAEPVCTDPHYRRRRCGRPRF
jgi:hypothetical protein